MRAELVRPRVPRREYRVGHVRACPGLYVSGPRLCVLVCACVYCHVRSGGLYRARLIVCSCFRCRMCDIRDRESFELVLYWCSVVLK